MCKQYVDKDVGADRKHACEVKQQLTRRCYRRSKIILTSSAKGTVITLLTQNVSGPITDP